MSKHTMRILVTWFLFLPWVQPSAEAVDLKIALVSMEHLFDKYHKTLAANARFKSRADEMDVKRRTFLNEIKSKRSELEALSAEARDQSLNDIEREKKKQQEEEKHTQLRDAEEKLVEFDRACKKQFGNQMRHMQQQLITEIRGIIQTYAKDHGITLILDSSGKTMNNVEAVVVSDKTLDITSTILEILNKDKPASIK